MPITWYRKWSMLPNPPKGKFSCTKSGLIATPCENTLMASTFWPNWRNTSWKTQANWVPLDLCQLLWVERHLVVFWKQLTRLLLRQLSQQLLSMPMTSISKKISKNSKKSWHIQLFWFFSPLSTFELDQKVFDFLTNPKKQWPAHKHELRARLASKNKQQKKMIAHITKPNSKVFFEFEKKRKNTSNNRPLDSNLKMLMIIFAVPSISTIKTIYVLKCCPHQKYDHFQKLQNVPLPFCKTCIHMYLFFLSNLMYLCFSLGPPIRNKWHIKRKGAVNFCFDHYALYNQKTIWKLAPSFDIRCKIVPKIHRNVKLRCKIAH